MTRAGFPHSDIPGSKLDWQLPEAFRSLLRLSSAQFVKASFICSYVTFYLQLQVIDFCWQFPDIKIFTCSHFYLP